MLVTTLSVVSQEFMDDSNVFAKMDSMENSAKITLMIAEMSNAKTGEPAKTESLHSLANAKMDSLENSAKRTLMIAEMSNAKTGGPAKTELIHSLVSAKMDSMENSAKTTLMIAEVSNAKTKKLRLLQKC